MWRISSSPGLLVILKQNAPRMSHTEVRTVQKVQIAFRSLPQQGVLQCLHLAISYSLPITLRAEYLQSPSPDVGKGHVQMRVLLPCVSVLSLEILACCGFGDSVYSSYLHLSNKAVSPCTSDPTNTGNIWATECVENLLPKNFGVNYQTV